MPDQARKHDNTITFLRLAAAELRKLAECAPEIALELRHTARQLESEAADLAESDTE